MGSGTRFGLLLNSGPDPDNPTTFSQSGFTSLACTVTRERGAEARLQVGSGTADPYRASARQLSTCSRLRPLSCSTAILPGRKDRAAARQRAEVAKTHRTVVLAGTRNVRARTWSFESEHTAGGTAARPLAMENHPTKRWRFALSNQQAEMSTNMGDFVLRR